MSNQNQNIDVAYSPTAAGIAHPTKAGVAHVLKLFGREFWNHLLLGMVSAMWLPRVVGPVVSLITGSRDVSPHWQTGAMLLMLLCYGFCVGKSDPARRVGRVLLQISFYIGSALLLVLVGYALSTKSALTLVFIGTSLGVGALVGSLFSSSVAEKPAQETEKKSTSVWSAIIRVVRIAVAFALGLGAVFGIQQLGKVAQKSIYVDKVAPTTIFETAAGDPWTFEEHRGNVVLIEFWAPYCGPCVASFPAQRRTHEEFSQYSDFEMVSVSCGDRERSIKMFDEKQAKWTLLFPPAEASPDDLRPYGIPAAYIVDRDGKIVAAQLRGNAVDSELKKLLQK